jgi:hypothetical protein
MENLCEDYVFDRVDELLNCDEIYIVGEGEYAELTEILLTKCIDKKLYGDKKAIIRHCRQEERNDEDFVGFCSVSELLKKDNSNSGLILCQNHEKSDRLTVNLIKSGFKNIIKGIELINCWYKEVWFWVDGAKEGITSDKEADSEMRVFLQTLKDDKDPDGYLKASKYFEEKGNYLLAYDYCLRGERASADRRSREEKHRLETVIESQDISLTDYAEAMDKYVTLPFFGRSGSIYFQSLLEGHSKLFTIPPGTNYFPYYKLYALFFAGKGTADVEEIVDALDTDDSLREDYQDAVNIRTDAGEDLYPEGFNNKFRHYLEIIIRDKLKRSSFIREKFIIQALFLAHNLALGRTVDFKKGIPYITNHLHTSDLDLEAKFLSMFSDDTVICTTRSLVQNFGSNIALYLRMFDAEMAKLKIMDLFFYYFNHPIFKKVAKDYKIYWAKLESMNERPGELLRSVSTLLDIDWEDSLTQSTINGEKMYDNYESGAKFQSGPRTSGVTKTYEEYLDSFDRYRLEVLYNAFLDMCNYPCTDYIDSELLKSTAGIPFRFERKLFFKDEIERTKYRDRIRRFVLNTADRTGDFDRGAKGSEVL